MDLRTGAGIVLAVAVLAGRACATPPTETDNCKLEDKGKAALAANDKHPQPLLFDALNQTVSGTPGKVQKGDTLKVIIVNINTFFEKYDLKIIGQDFHGGAAPEGLAKWLQVGTIQERPFPQASAGLPDNLINEYNKLRLLIEEYIANAEGYRDRTRLLHAELVQEIYGNPTNGSIRRGVITKLESDLRKWPADSSGIDLSELVPPNIAEFLKCKHTAFGEKDGINKDMGFASMDASLAASYRLMIPKMKVLQEFEAFYRSQLDTSLKDVDDSIQAVRNLLNKLPETNPAEKQLKETELRRFENEFVQPWGRIKSKHDIVLTTGSQILDRVRLMMTIVLDPKRTPAWISREEEISGVDAVKVTLTTEPHDAPNFEGTASEKPDSSPTQSKTVRSETVGVYNRWVVSFAGGFAATTLKQTSYGSRKLSNGDLKVVRGPDDAADLQPAVFAHYYQTTKSGHAFGPVLGATLGSPNRYLVGIGYVRGRQSRLSLMMGAAFGDVTRLKGDRLGGQPVDKSPQTTDVLRIGAFISGGYSFRF